MENIKDFSKIQTLILTCEKTTEMVKEAKSHVYNNNYYY